MGDILLLTIELPFTPSEVKIWVNRGCWWVDRLAPH